MMDPVSPDADAGPPEFLETAMRRLAQGPTLAEFTAWFAHAHAELFMRGARARSADPAAAADEAGRAAGVLAREIWRRTPDPARGWQARRLPAPGRNDPCFCGSGRKFKQCCQPLLSEFPPLELDPAVFASLLFPLGPDSWRTPQALQAMPGEMLLAAINGWEDAHGAAGVAELLEPLFQAPASLAARHADAFDTLVDVLLDLHLDEQRERLVRRVAEQAGDRVLRGAAHGRLAALAADRRDQVAAWTALRQAQRDIPDDPNLMQLELVLLLNEGREGEARLRAPVLAARARRLGLPDFADRLQDVAARGMAALLDAAAARDAPDAEEQAWIDLLREPLAGLRPEAFARLHDIVCEGEGPDAELSIVPTKAALRLVKPWLARFAPPAPMMTMAASDADALLEDAVAAREWLRQQPDAAATVPVLDGLLMAARLMTLESDSPALMRAACALAFAAADVVESALASWPQARLSWLDMDNRPLLRIVSQAIGLAMELPDEERVERWMRWMLARNPTDNHGWREYLRTLLLRRGDAAGALAVLDAYPDDGPPSHHDRALALYLLQRTGEAAEVLRRAHADWPAFVPALLPEALDRPAEDSPHGMTVGGAEQAWHWRSGIRPAWVRSGALDWLRGLELPAPAPRKKAVAKKPAPKKVGKAAAKGRRLKAAADGRIAPQQFELLQAQYGGQFPWLLGWLASCAWAPGLVMPTLWAADAMARAEDKADMRGVQALLDAVMNQYNAFNEQRLDAAAGAPVPLPAVLPQADDAAWIGFAAGFVQAAEKHGAGVWRAAGATVSSRKPPFAALYQLAARAPAGPDGWCAAADTGQPLLELAQDQPPARELLAHALQPLWRLALAARP